eukprot:1181887-Prorocentrum_minimum.AAC.5
MERRVSMSTAGRGGGSRVSGRSARGEVFRRGGEEGPIGGGRVRSCRGQQAVVHRRLKYLFLCGSVVIHVKYTDQIAEFYENVLVPNVHYIVVNDPEEVP